MTTVPTPDLDAAAAAIQRGHDEIARICTGERRWTMSVPARHDSDSDLVLSAALTAGERALAELRAARAEAEQLRAELERAYAEARESATRNGRLIRQVRELRDQWYARAGLAEFADALDALLDEQAEAAETTPDDAVLAEVRAERARQDAKWGPQDHPDGTGGKSSMQEARYYRERCQAAAASGNLSWRHILREEVFEAFAESDPDQLYTELIQVAAVAVNWAGNIAEQRAAQPTPDVPVPDREVQRLDGTGLDVIHGDGEPTTTPAPDTPCCDRHQHCRTEPDICCAVCPYVLGQPDDTAPAGGEVTA